MELNIIKSASMSPNGLKNDERALKLGIQYTVPIDAISSYPTDRQFTIDNNGKIKTPIISFMKSNTEKTTSGNLRLVDPTGWYMSEKLDGLRAMWDGSVIITTSGSVPNFIPDWFKEILPPGIAIDGEIWMGRDMFSGTNGVSGIFSIKPGPKASYTIEKAELKWLDISYNVFDIPNYDVIFESRMDILKKVVQIRTEFWPEIQKKYYDKYITNMPKVAEKIMKKECPIKFAEQILIENSQHFQEFFQTILEKKGEGLIVRKAGSKYEGKRSTSSIKFKQIDDAECKVIEIIPGTSGSKYDRVIEDKFGNKHPVLGAIKCIRTDSLGNPILKDGKEIMFKIGTGFSDEFRENYWNPEKPEYYIINQINNKYNQINQINQISAIITFTYMKINEDSGTPREPRFFRIRVPIIEQ